MSCTIAAGLLLVGCANDPMYLPAAMNLEAGTMDMAGMLTVARASMVLPIKLETAADATARAARAATLMVAVPYVKIGDLEVSIEWTIKNLDAVPGRATIELDGANELFSYDPSTLVLDPGNNEAPPAPGLDGNIPIDVPASGEVSGLFREDQLQEASIDLDQITRGNVNPFAATLTISKNIASFQPLSPPQPSVNGVMPPQTPVGSPIPREAFAQMTQIDLVFKPDHHMVLEFEVRVRDIRGIMHDLLLSAPSGELTAFAPVAYAGPPP